jgi:hypothetical protein
MRDFRDLWPNVPYYCRGDYGTRVHRGVEKPRSFFAKNKLVDRGKWSDHEPLRSPRSDENNEGGSMDHNEIEHASETIRTRHGWSEDQLAQALVSVFVFFDVAVDEGSQIRLADAGGWDVVNWQKLIEAVSGVDKG